jgi:hypothetical protein
MSENAMKVNPAAREKFTISQALFNLLVLMKD